MRCIISPACVSHIQREAAEEKNAAFFVSEERTYIHADEYCSLFMQRSYEAGA